MYFVINKTSITGTVNDANPYGQTDLALFAVTPSCDLSLDDVYFDESTILPGNSIEFCLQITNNGEEPVEEYVVNIMNDAGDTLLSTPIAKVIMPGSTQEVIVKYTMEEDEFTPQNMQISLDVNKNNETDKSNNAISVKFDYTDIALENVAYGMNESGEAVISGEVVNRGYGDCKNIIVDLREQTADGKVVDTYQTNSTLGNLDITPFEFHVNYEQDKVYYVTISTDDMMSGNNEGFVVLNNEEIQKPERTTTTTVVSGNQLDININGLYRDAVLIVASYDQDKRLISFTTQDISSETDNIKMPIELNGATEIQVFVWDSMEGMIPLSEGEIIPMVP